VAVIRPLARSGELLLEEVEGELLVYDQRRHVACRLNRTAALVWESADGERSVEDLVEVLRGELGGLADGDLVMVTLDRLEEHGLIESGYERRDFDTARLSRRRFIRRVGVVGAAALALPVVQSVVSPTPAAAAGSESGVTCYCPCYCGSCSSCNCDTCVCGGGSCDTQSCDYCEQGSCGGCGTCGTCGTVCGACC
jgi:DNA-binding transcriptional ArsR family regulator